MQYEIVGGAFPVVVCHLEQGEQMRTEQGSMVWMDPCMQMETKSGGLGKMFSRSISGEAVFQNVYTAHAAGKIAFGSSFPGKIMPFEIGPGNSVIVQKQSFLASTMGVDLKVHFQQRLGSGFFGGEGFIMQQLSGSGLAFVECNGDLVEYDLAAGQQLIVDTGNVLGYSEGVKLEIQRVKGVKNMMFGGEGVFNTVLTGPGKVWLQTFSVAGFTELIMEASQKGA